MHKLNQLNYPDHQHENKILQELLCPNVIF